MIVRIGFIPACDDAVDRVVELRPVVGARRASSARSATTARRCAPAGSRAPPILDRRVGLGAAGEQDPVVGDAELRTGGAGGGGEDEQGGEYGEGSGAYV